MQATSSPFRPGPLPGTVLPEYDGRGLANVVPTVERHFNVQTDIAPLSEAILPPHLLDGVRRVVTLLIDALGLQQLERAMQRGHAPYMSALLAQDNAHLGRITSTFPSTTVCALTTLGTGLPPGRHGVTNQQMYDSSLGTVIDILYFSPVVAGRGLDTAGIDAGQWLGLPTVYERLGPSGIAPIVVNHEQFKGTSLSRINHRGARYHGFRTISDLAVNLRAVMESSAELAYIHAYWGTLDSITHEYGPMSPQHDAEVRVIDHALGEILLRKLRAPGTLLLLLADHGHIQSDAEHAVWLNDHPELLALLQAPPVGLDRAGVLYVRPGCEAEALRYAEERLTPQVHVMSAEESLELGLYGPGPLPARSRQRMGQLLLLPVEDWRVKYQVPGKERKVWNVGTHGGLTPEEMLVPLLAVRLG
ncbi:MAG: alkaline phosphatase family protein [Chloroflexota bacterium]|nr:alkaline phosphatase family protein [Chloroflexota bacterium]